MNDLYDIIDTVLLKHHIIDVIGIATPGIIKDNQHLRSSIDGSDQDIKNEFEKKYHIDVFIYNNANAAVVGFSLEHEEYKNIIFHSQPWFWCWWSRNPCKWASYYRKRRNCGRSTFLFKKNAIIR